MQQIVDLQAEPEFRSLDVAFVSIAHDSVAELASGADEYGIVGVPMASDADGSVSNAYGVLQWAVASGEPGHTFVLVDTDGDIVWIRDYGAPENGGMMYVPPMELVGQMRIALLGE